MINDWGIVFYFLISFLVTLIATSAFIKFFIRIGLVVKDMNKENTPLVPISGGIPVMIGVVSGLMCFIFLETFFYKSQTDLLSIFAASSVILIVAFIGFVDDLLVHNSHERSIGLRQWQKPLLTFFAAVPLMVIRAGFTTMGFPILGEIDFGIFYPLIIIPLGFVGATNMVNLLEGFNGLGTGMGIIYTGMLGLYAYSNSRHTAALICLVVFASLLAFFLFNKYPAKILPGDSLTYLLGATLALVAILGNMERAVIIASIPFIIEILLKLRGNLKKQTYGFYKDGKVQSRYKKIYSIPHILTRTGKYTEKQVVYFMIFIELVFASMVWLV
jgi:UDP-N-acetylglucosamine--dolichyl-phosphate N-acetylglucosaminephosphotransferase